MYKKQEITSSVSESNAEEADEYSEGTERMQLNPSTDFYDDDDDDDDGDDDQDYKSEYDGINRNEDDNYDEDFDEEPEINKEDLNEEGSGEDPRISSLTHRSYLHKNRFELEKPKRYKKKQEEKTSSGSESYGEEDNDDDDIGSTGRSEGSGGNFRHDDDEDNNDDDGFFSGKRKSNNRYFRKNTNDAIKFISTPLGKVGIVYQQSATTKVDVTKFSSASDFDSLIPHETGSSKSSSTYPKITPVLTADGKVALLYRGDSENTKYEPILNGTHKINMYDNKTSTITAADVKLDKTIVDNVNKESFDDKDWEDDDYDDEKDDKNINSPEESRTDKITQPITTDNSIQMVIENESDNSVLPMINRPLSEVLGIKKNQFKQFRIKDNPTTIQPENKEFSHTTVDLGEYSHRNKNYDFDFGLDRTMLDEQRNVNNRVRVYYNKDNQDNTDGNKNSISSDIASEDVLSKTEVVNLAIVPHFDEEFEQQQHLHEYETNRRNHRQRYRYRQLNEDLSEIHCIMQAIMGIAAISAVFGMLGAFFKQRILDQIRMMQW